MSHIMMTSLISLPGHPEWVLVIGLVPLVHHGPVQHSGDEVVTGSLYIVESNLGSVERFGLGQDRAFGIDTDYNAIGTLFFDLATDSWKKKFEIWPGSPSIFLRVFNMTNLRWLTRYFVRWPTRCFFKDCNPTWDGSEVYLYQVAYFHN